jgi:hypothetical protein
MLHDRAETGADEVGRGEGEEPRHGPGKQVPVTRGGKDGGGGAQGSALARALGRLGRLVVHPVPLLVLQLLVVYGARHQEHGFRPAHMPDTASYLRLAEAKTVAGALSSYRTYGYPLFLRLVGGGEVDTAQVPRIQFGLYSLAILLFWLALRRYTRSRWWAFAGATPLAYAWVIDLMPEIMTDVLAVTVILVVVSLVLLLAARPAAPLLWTGLALAVFAAYQIRPSTLFLIFWVPLAAAALRLCRGGHLGPGLLRWLSGLALATVLPFFLFAGLRLAVVGHFGLVPFGGTNLVGVAACFLDASVVEELPEEHRDLARRMLELRQKKGLQPMTSTSDPFVSFRQYGINIWQVAFVATGPRIRRLGRRLAERGQIAPGALRNKRNQLLTGVARSIIRARPWLYLRWVRSAVLYGLRGLAGRPWIVWPFVLLVCSTPMLALRRAAGASPGPGRPEGRPLLGIFIMGASYFLVYLVLLSMVSWPFPRYASAMIIFLPAVLCMQLFAVCRRLLRLRR